MADDGIVAIRAKKKSRTTAIVSHGRSASSSTKASISCDHLNAEREHERHEDRGDDQRSNDSEDRHDAEAACKTPEFMGRTHFASSLSPSRINCLVSAPSPALRAAAAMAAAACG